MPFEKTFHVAWAHLLEPMRVTFTFAGLSDDASRFRIRNEISRDDGQLAARLTSLGGWFDLNLRKLVAPPEALVDALRALDRSDDFEKLESSLRK